MLSFARSFRSFAAAVLALAAAAAFAGCSKPGSVHPANSLTIALPIAPNTLNPIFSTSSTEAFLNELFFPELTSHDAEHHEIPMLATEVPSLANHGISRDGLTITYHLRPNAVWSDGVPITSRDVKYSYQQVMNPANNVISRHGYNVIASISTPNAHTVVLHLKHPFPPLIEQFFGEGDNVYGILPEHVLAKYPSLNNVPFNGEPTVTGGPYRFGEWVRGDHITAIANPTYYLGAPKIGKLVIKLIADVNTTTSELRTGEVQAAIELTGPAYHDLANDPHVARLAVDAPVYDSMMFNVTHAPLDDRNVRVALAYATDRATIMRDNEFGDATLGVADLSPFYWAFDPSIAAQPYDPARARALLQAAGWTPGPGGIREKNGKRLSLLLVYGQGSDIARNVVVQIQQMWRAVGVDVQPKAYPYAQLYAPAASGGVFYGGKFDVGFYAWIAGGDPDDSSQWLSTAVPPAGNNVARYDSPAMDAAQHEALSTFDRTVRKRAYAKIERLVVDDVPAIFLFYPKQRYAFSPELRNFHPNGIVESWNAQDWSWANP